MKALYFRVLIGAMLSLGQLASAQTSDLTPQLNPLLKPQAALRLAHASQASLLASAQAGTRLVAVGEHGVVMLSDDQGKTWRQAQAVPLRSTLTAVSFANAQQGWAVGHWGAVLHTADGGETWALQRSDTASDRPLFAVQALDAEHVVAVGLWSLVLTSADAGKTWHPVKLEAPPAVPGTQAHSKADLNLFQLFTDAQGRVYAAGEQGMLLRSGDLGQSWAYLPTGYKGSFWAGAAPAPGVLLAAGLRGSIYRSGDDGKTWQRIESGSKASITALLSGPQGITALGLDGLLLRSRDMGLSFSGEPRPDRANLTAGLLLADGRSQLFSRNGIVKD